MKASVLAGAAVLSPLAKGARMPSTAEEVCAETRRATLRAAADLRCGLDCLSVMPTMVRLHDRQMTLYSPTNGRMQEVTGEHPKDITLVLQALVRDGLLTQQNQRRWASYRVAGDSPQPSTTPPRAPPNRRLSPLKARRTPLIHPRVYPHTYSHSCLWLWRLARTGACRPSACAH